MPLPNRPRVPTGAIPARRSAAVGRLLHCGVLAALLIARIGATPAVAPPILVGGSTDNYPYSFLDEQGRLDGFAVDVFDAAARAMALNVRRVQAPSAEVNRLFQAGQITIHPYFSQRAEHLGYADFSVPYLTLQGAVFFRRGDHRFKSLADLRLKGARIVTGPAGRDYALAHGFSAAQLVVTGSEDALRQLADGRCDAALFARLSGISVRDRLGLENIDPEALGLEDYVLRNGFAVNAGQTPLLAQLNEGLAVIYRSGEFEAIYRKWFGRFEPRRFSRAEFITYLALALALALAITAWALRRQRQLRLKIARQAAELAESQTILAEAQRFARIGHWQAKFGSDRSLTWSAETYRIFEHDPALGPPPLDVLVASCVAEDRGRWTEFLQSARRRSLPAEIEIRIEPRPGLLKTIHLLSRPVLDPSGRCTALFGTVQDVSERRQAQDALRQSEQLLRALYDTLPHALGVVEQSDHVWRIVSMNPGAVRLLGLAAAPAVGTTIGELGLTPERQAFWNELFVRCATTATTLALERTDPHRARDFSITLVPLEPADAARRPRCCFLVKDITDRNRRDAEIARGRRLRAIGELVGGIAHEFNNLLTPVLLKADLLESHAALPPALADEIRIIAAATRRSADLTRRLLAFGRGQERTTEPVELPAVIAANLDLVRQTIDRRISVAAFPATALPTLWLNGGDVHQILLNLLINARDTLVEKLAQPHAADWSAAIEVSAVVLPATAATALHPPAAGAPECWVRLTVRDNGLGMHPAVLERIFEPFYTTKPVGTGTGLGLATVWHLVADLGGRIDVESTVGVGTAFHVCLPVYPPPPPAVTAPQPVASVDRPFAARHLLVAEDEEMISKLVGSILRRAGHTVELAADGEAAWQLLAAAPARFDAVLMDLNMPGCTGVELARRARALPYAGPLFVMSGRISDEDRLELTRLKITAMIPKPFVHAELLATLALAGITAAPDATRPGQL